MSYHTISYYVISYHIISHISCHIIPYRIHIMSYHTISYVIYHIISHRLSCHIISYSYHVISYHIICHIPYHITSYIMSYHITSYHITSYHTLYHIIYHVISYHITSYHIISYLGKCRDIWYYTYKSPVVNTLLWRWVHTCNVIAFRNSVSWQCGRDSWPRNVSKVGYVVTLRACSVCCRYLAVASKGWYGYGLSRSGHATWHVTTVRSFLFFFKA